MPNDDGFAASPALPHNSYALLFFSGITPMPRRRRHREQKSLQNFASTAPILGLFLAVDVNPTFCPNRLYSLAFGCVHRPLFLYKIDGLWTRKYSIG
ncbi:MAG: hypothetical protein ACYTXE_33830 [Nostoc sp.]